MTILWCGCESLDFVGSNKPSIQYRYYNGNYSRHDMYVYDGIDGIQTERWGPSDGQNLWVSSIIGAYGSWIDHGGRMVGVLNSVNSGFIIGSNGSSMFLQNTNNVVLATGSLWFGNGLSGKLDIHIENCGPNGTITVYFNGVEHVKYTGDIRPVSGNIDFVTTSYHICTYRLCGVYMSEIIVADEDTRLMRVKTIALNANGDNNEWTGGYSNINEEGLDTTTKIYTADVGSNFQANATGMPSGTWSVRAVRIATQSVDATGMLGLQMGIKTNEESYLEDTNTSSGYWKTDSMIMNTNPITNSEWTPLEIENLQIHLRSKAL